LFCGLLGKRGEVSLDRFATAGLISVEQQVFSASESMDARSDEQSLAKLRLACSSALPLFLGPDEEPEGISPHHYRV
jgi:hypothetical protein